MAQARGSTTRATVRFTETQGSLLAIGVWASFGLVLAGEMRTSLWDPAAIAFAVLSLTVIRMVPVALALVWFALPAAHRRFRWLVWAARPRLDRVPDRWPGGDSTTRVSTGPLAAVVSWTVLLSVILHGISAGPLAARYGRFSQHAGRGCSGARGISGPAQWETGVGSGADRR